MVRCAVVLPFLVACADPAAGPAPEDAPKDCSSTTRAFPGAGYVDIVTFFDEVGREVLRFEDHYTSTGAWLGRVGEEHGYVDGLLLSVKSTWTGPDDATQELPTERLLTYAYDDVGRRVEERTFVDGAAETTQTLFYDDLGQEVGAERLDADGALLSVDERWWSEGRLDRWERRGPDDNVFLYEDYDYLLPAPALDAVVTGDLSYGLYTDRYDGERLVERAVDASVPLWGGTVWQWVWRDDGQEELQRTYHPDHGWELVQSDYDAQGRIVARTWGPDADRDDVLDEVELEQTWDWSCD